MTTAATAPAPDAVGVLWEREDPEDEALLARLEHLGAALLAAAGVSERDLSIVVVDEPAIHALNKQYLGEDKPTDVLSFPMDEGEILASPGPRPLGDVVIGLEVAAAQARAHGWSLDEELTFLLVHGFCHLLGHDHAEPGEAAEMRAAEDRLLAAVAPGQRRPPTPY